MKSLPKRIVEHMGNDLTAYLQWLAACIIWVLSYAYVSQHKIDCFSSCLSRSIVLILVNLPSLLTTKFNQVPTKQMNTMVIRHLLLSLYGFIFPQSFFYLPINLVHTIGSTGPLFILLIDYFLFKVTITKKQFYGVVLASLGMLLAVNGNLLYLYFNPEAEFHSQFQNYRPQASDPVIQVISSCILVIVVALWGYSMVMVKMVENVTVQELNFHYGVMMIMFSGCLYPNTEISSDLRISSFIFGIIFHGIPLAVAQALFSHSLMLTKNHGITTMMQFITIVVGYGIKIWRYDQSLNPICVTGTLMIVGGIYGIVMKY